MRIGEPRHVRIWYSLLCGCTVSRRLEREKCAVGMDVKDLLNWTVVGPIEVELNENRHIGYDHSGSRSHRYRIRSYYCEGLLCTFHKPSAEIFRWQLSVAGTVNTIQPWYQAPA